MYFLVNLAVVAMAGSASMAAAQSVRFRRTEVTCSEARAVKTAAQPQTLDEKSVIDQ
jgi:hypothetical protein